jgi:hypothetical protein
MRFILYLMLVAGPVGTAAAHTISGDGNVLKALDHQLFGWHHLPVTILLIIVGVAFVRSRYRERQRDE